MTSLTALSSVEHVIATANRFFQIADSLHRRLNTISSSPQFLGSPNDSYSLLIEEYGLRARSSILRNDAINHVVVGPSVSQSRFDECLELAAKKISLVEDASTLRALVAGVSTLCVCISPTKGAVIEYLTGELEADLNSN